MKRVDYRDEIISFLNGAAQLASTLQKMSSEDWPRIEGGFIEQKKLSLNFKPVAKKPDGLQITNPNVPDPGNPIEELAVLRRKLELTLAGLDHAAKLLAERREAIAKLLA